MWYSLMCSLRLTLSSKTCTQNWQECVGFTAFGVILWIFCRCLVSVFFLANLDEQKWHGYGRSPVWVRRCSMRCPFCLNFFEHDPHAKSLFPPWPSTVQETTSGSSPAPWSNCSIPAKGSERQRTQNNEW